jgi:signal transduction histidine kinase/ligand-binding sensor domain-containing protein
LKYKIFLCIVFGFIVSSKAITQTYNINYYSIESGLPTSFIYDATQDERGRMWFATPKGLTVYDGFQWQNIDRIDSQQVGSCRKLFKDEKGIIWAVPLYMCERIFYFENDIPKIIDLPEVRKEKSNYGITALSVNYEDGKPVIYAGSFNGIYIYKNSQWKNINVSEGLPSNEVFSITNFKNILYVATSKGVVTLESGKITDRAGNIFKQNNNGILAFAQDKNPKNPDRLWVLCKNWIGYIENENLQIVKNNFQFPDGMEFQYPSLCTDRNNLVYFGNYYYTFCLNKNNDELFQLTHNQGFKSDGSTSIFTDREDNLWKVGTRGIDKVNSFYLMNLGSENGLLENEVSAIYESETGELILGHNNGITFYKKEKVKPISFQKSDNRFPGDLRVLDICCPKKGIYWFAASSGGVGKIDLAGNISWANLPEKFYVSSVASDKNGVVWVTSNKGAYYIKDDKLTEPKDFEIKKQFYRRVVSIGDVLYFLSSTCLAEVRDNKVTYYENHDNYDANNVYSIFQDTQDRVFIGTKEGLYIINNGKQIKFTENDFRIDKPVYSILQDKKGNYWFGTDEGVIMWDINKWKHSFQKANGLSGTEINRAAFCCDNSGNVWVGTESGLSCFRPEYYREKIPVPEVIFLNAEDPLGEKHSLKNDFSIKSDIKSLYFSFRGLSYYNERFMSYRVKLEGFDADWYEISQQQLDKIRYTNLKPGDYRLFVSAKNISGEWSKVYSSSLITIDKPYYRKWWFIVLFILIFGFLIYFIYRLYLTRIYYINLEKKVSIRTAKLRETESELRNTQAFLEEKVKERTEKLNILNEQLREINASKDKFFSIIAHDLKSPFVGLLGYSELMKNEVNGLSKESIKEYSENLHKNIRNTYNLLENLLNWALLQTRRMVFKEQRLDLFLEMKSIIDMFDANLRTKSISVINDIKMDSYVSADKNMFRTIMHNLISNAIKYSNPGGLIKIYSKNVNGNVEIYVKDEGVGMEKEIKEKLFKINMNISTKGTAKERGTGLGLILIKEMIDMHNGKISVESEPGIGTTFCVILPNEI